MSGAKSNFFGQIKKNPSYGVGSAVLVMVAGRLNFSDGHVGGPEVFLLLSALLYARYIVHSASQEAGEDNQSTPASEVALRLAAGFSFVAGNVRACLLHYVARSPVWVDLVGPLVAYASMLCCAKMVANMIWDRSGAPDDPDNAPLFDKRTKRHLFFLSTSAVLTWWLFKNVYGAGSLTQALAHAVSVSADGFLNPALSSVGIAAEFGFFALLLSVFVVAYHAASREDHELRVFPFRDVIQQQKELQDKQDPLAAQIIRSAQARESTVVSLSAVISYLHESVSSAGAEGGSNPETEEKKSEQGSSDDGESSSSLGSQACLNNINNLFKQACQGVEDIFDSKGESPLKAAAELAAQQLLTALRSSKLFNPEGRLRELTEENKVVLNKVFLQTQEKLAKTELPVVKALVAYWSYLTIGAKMVNLRRYYVEDQRGWHLETAQQAVERLFDPFVEKVARALISVRAYLQVAIDRADDNSSEKTRLEALAQQLIPHSVWQDAQRGQLSLPARSVPAHPPGKLG
jgi:hypothetical protein